jgi:hypothetical protein
MLLWTYCLIYPETSPLRGRFIEAIPEVILAVPLLDFLSLIEPLLSSFKA